MKPSAGTWFLGAAVTVVIVAIVAGLLVLGSPTEERARRLDDRRVADLQGIMAATDLYWTRHDRLPGSFAELSGEPGVTIVTEDPERAETYGYQPLDSIRYELCATFDRASEEISRDPGRDLWLHGTGRQCFELEAKGIADDER